MRWEAMIMIEWLMVNKVSMIIVVIIVAFCIWVILKGIRDVANGRSSCGCSDCSGCATHCSVQDLKNHLERNKK